MALRLAAIAALLIAGLLAAVALWSDGGTMVPEGAPDAGEIVGHDTSPSDRPAAADSSGPVAPPVRQAPSQVGSEVDGQIAFDGFGRLIVDHALRRVFDYHLAAIGELDLDDIREALHALAFDAGGAHGAAQVLAAFERYLTYLDQVDRLVLAPDADLLHRFEALHALRRQSLGDAVAEAYFGDEEAAALDLIARVEGAKDAVSMLPTDETDLALEQTRQFEREGTDAATRHAERSALFGDAAALRLAALDEERARWQQRVEAYRSARTAIIDDPSLDEAARRAALAALLEAGFNEAERRRVLSLLDDG